MIHTDGTRTIANAGPPLPGDKSASKRAQLARPDAAELKKLSTDRDLAQSC